MSQMHPLITLFDKFYEKSTHTSKERINKFFGEISDRVSEYGSNDLTNLVEDVKINYTNPNKRSVLEERTDQGYFVEKTGKSAGGRINTLLGDYPTNADVLHLYLGMVHLTIMALPKRAGPMTAVWIEEYLHTKGIIRKPVLRKALGMSKLTQGMDAKRADLPQTPRQQWTYRSLKIFHQEKQD